MQYIDFLHAVNTLVVAVNRDVTKEYNLSRRRNNALRKEQDFNMITNKQTKAYYQKQAKMPTESNTIPFNPVRIKRVVDLVPKSINQENYILALTNEGTDIVVVTGPAGTGKTYLAMLAAIRALRNREVERIVLSRPAVGVDDEKHGFLPGDLNQKMEPWTRPLLDVLREYYSVAEIKYMIDEQIVEIAPLAFMRGRTFRNSWIIVDEAQNTTPNQLKMVMTRIGEGSKIVITGDTDQTDRKTADNGLLDLQKRLQQQPTNGIECCTFTNRDVQRHPIIESVLKLYS